MSADSSPPRLDWTRFWSAQDGVIDLSDQGYLVDPLRYAESFGQTRLQTLANLEPTRCLTLLGEPGMGKSDALSAEVSRRVAGAQEGVAVIYRDLRAFSSDALLVSRVFDSAEVQAWKAGSGELVLHLDSLDEALLRIESIAALLAAELPALPTERLSVRVACRTAVWQAVAPILQPVFQELWGDNVGVYEISPLRRVDVRQASERWSVDPDTFFQQVRVVNATPFAIKPLTLNLLLRLFRREGQLPESLIELYRNGCISLCEERSSTRRAAGRAGQLSPESRFALAGRIAAVSMFANRYAVWVGPESERGPEADAPLAELAVGSETVEGRTIEVSREKLREVLDTGLFSSRGNGRMGWAHQSYAEFLAADYLVRRGVAPHAILDLLLHPSGGLVPQLEMVAAWTASLDSAVREALTARDPLTLLHGDLTAWTPEALRSLTEALLSRMDEGRAHDFEFRIADRYDKLSYPGLAESLRPYLTDPARNVVARRAAIQIAAACSVSELEAELLGVALSADEDPYVRAYAVSALKTCGDQAVWPDLRPLALEPTGSDPNGEIKGAALRVVWPDYLSAAELFRHITPPRESFFGAYAGFLAYELPKTLHLPDLPVALGWATDFVRSLSSREDFQRRALADAVFEAGWEAIQEPGLVPLLVEYARTAIETQHELFVGIDQKFREEFRARVAGDVDGRRAFLREVVGQTATPIFGFSLVQSGLLRSDDLFWLLSLAPGGAEADPAVNEDTLCSLVRQLLDFRDEAQFEAAYEASLRWPLLRRTFSGVFDGVLLGSSEADQLREIHRLQTEQVRPAPQRLEPPSERRVQDDLSRFEAGDLAAWWQLNRNLTLTATSTYYGSELEYRIERMPGWEMANRETRERILDAAAVFLDRADPSIDEWIGTGRARSHDLAAYRALLLLRAHRPDAYGRSEGVWWRKWAPLVVAIPRESGSDDARYHDPLMADASRLAPEIIAVFVGERVRREKRSVESSSDTQSDAMMAYFFLRDVDPRLLASPLDAELLAELADPSNNLAQLNALLEFLLKAGSQGAREYALTALSGDVADPGRRPRALNAAALLLEVIGAPAWPLVWPIIEARRDFARDLMLRLAHHHLFGANVFARLSEKDLGELYVFLERLFPHAEDPHHDGAHTVGPRESVVQLREGVLSVLVHRGTTEAVSAVRNVVVSLPELPWLSFRLLEVDKLMRRKTWSPLPVTELLRLVSTSDGRLVQSPEQLVAILVESLRRYDRELHGAQNPVRALWDRQAGGPFLRPVEEDALSDQVRLFLQRDLVARGIVVNREVEIGRVPGAPIGSRTDIRVNAVRRTSGGETYDAIEAVIESKGCWNAELMRAMESQLRDDYLTRLGAPIGIYLVGWFDKARWDPNDGRRARSPSWDVAEAQRRLDDQALNLSGGFEIRAVVLNCAAP